MTSSDISDGPEYKEMSQCERCGLEHEANLSNCPHCSALNDNELQGFLDKYDKELHSNAKLGKLYIVAALIIGVLIFAYFIY